MLAAPLSWYHSPLVFFSISRPTVRSVLAPPKALACSTMPGPSGTPAPPEALAAGAGPVPAGALADGPMPSPPEALATGAASLAGGTFAPPRGTDVVLNNNVLELVIVNRPLRQPVLEVGWFGWSTCPFNGPFLFGLCLTPGAWFGQRTLFRPRCGLVLAQRDLGRRRRPRNQPEPLARRATITPPPTQAAWSRGRR